MDIEMDGDINVASDEEKDTQVNNLVEHQNGNGDHDHEQLSSQTVMSASSADLENANFITPSSTTTPTIPLVLDNITNSPRSLIQDVFSNSPTIKCHDEDRLTGVPPNTQMQQPIGDFIKGICF